MQVSNKTLWHHVAWVFSENQFKLFIDGKKVSETQTSGFYLYKDNNSLFLYYLTT